MIDDIKSIIKEAKEAFHILKTHEKIRMPATLDLLVYEAESDSCVAFSSVLNI